MMLFKGFRFGLLLQLAIGPVCIFIFQVAVDGGFFAGFAGALGVALTDGLEITLAILGVGTLIEKHKKLKTALKIAGSAVLFLFGLHSIISVFHVDLLSGMEIAFLKSTSENVFIHSILLTISNPLTAIFWAGVFSAKIIEENMQQNDLKSFGLGCVISTLFFLTLISAAGSLTQTFIPQTILLYLNAIVGVLLLYYSVKTLKS